MKFDSYKDFEQLLGTVHVEEEQVFAFSSIEYDMEQIYDLLSNNNVIDEEDEEVDDDFILDYPLRTAILKEWSLSYIQPVRPYLDPDYHEIDQDLEWEHIDNIILPGLTINGFWNGEEAEFEITMGGHMSASKKFRS